MSQGNLLIFLSDADKVSAFISLMRVNELNIVYLLDNFTEQKPKANIDNLVNKEDY